MMSSPEARRVSFGPGIYSSCHASLRDLFNSWIEGPQLDAECPGIQQCSATLEDGYRL